MSARIASIFEVNGFCTPHHNTLAHNSLSPAFFLSLLPCFPTTLPSVHTHPHTSIAILAALGVLALRARALLACNTLSIAARSSTEPVFGHAQPTVLRAVWDGRASRNVRRLSDGKTPAFWFCVFGLEWPKRE